MSNYIIFTDSGCDISPALLAQWDVRLIHLNFRFDDLGQDMTNEDMPIHTFYEKMRGGGISKTSAANPEAFRAAFAPVLAAGSDILYISFSSGLSNSISAANMTAQDLLEQYPARCIRIVDSLCASAGQGLFLHLAVERKKRGDAPEAVAAYLGEQLPHLCHWFTVDDLVYLKRGGRVSSAAAFFGGVLNIKPVLHVDDAGHLVSVSKVRGRRHAILALAEQYAALALDPKGGEYFISHGDCLDDAKALEAILREKFGNSAALITDIGPVIGSHSGPGTLALFFLGAHR